MTKKRTKLVYKIIRQNIFFAIIPLIIFCVLFYVYTKKTFVMIKENEVVEEIGNLHSSIDVFLSNIISNLSLAANNPVIRGPEYSKEKKENELIRLKSTLKIYQDIALIYEKGDVISINQSHKNLWNEEKWFDKAFEGEILISPVHIAGDPRRHVIEFAVPVNTGSDPYIITGVVLMEHIWRIVRDYRIDLESDIIVLNNTGEVIANTDNSKKTKSVFYDEIFKKIKHKNSGSLIMDYDNNEVFCVFKRGLIRNGMRSPWKIVVIQPFKKAFWVIYYLKIFILSSLLLLSVIVIIGSIFQSNKIVSPLNTFIEKIEDVRAGNLCVKTGIKTNDEIEYLSETFNSMVENLKNMKMKLEEKNISLQNINEEMQKRLIMSEKINIIGKLSSGFSHNLRNTVFLVKNYIRSSIEEAEPQKREAILNTTGEAIDNILDTIDPLLYFAKSHEKESKRLSLREVLENITKVVDLFFESNRIKLITDYKNAPVVKINEGDIQQAVLNILLNAKDAYNGEEGEVVLKLYDRVHDDKRVAVIEITDQGIGMSRETIEKAFQPFYSTKNDGKIKGTGVGLYISKIMVESNSGEILVNSKVGKGTTFIIIFAEALT
ncbi:MAG: hypothetical protein KAI43_12725 [Candidatus Aureabacteria bacterium]|nr:hypothetical protein [Candidatus Auribacterota bacterium]